MQFPHGVWVTHRKATKTTDNHGNTSTSWSESQWGPCAVWDEDAEERTDPHQSEQAVRRSVAGPRRAIGEGDQLVIAGEVHEVNGRPNSSTVSPFTGWDPGIVVSVVRAS